MKEFYRQKYPHIQPVGATFFITFRLFESLPKVKLDDLTFKYYQKIERVKLITNQSARNVKLFDIRKNYFKTYDEILDQINVGPHFLKNPDVCQIVKDQIHRFDGELYNLICYCIMSNHVHLLIETNLSQEVNEIETSNVKLFGNHTLLSLIMQRIKGVSARHANKFLGKTGPFWDKEYFDMYIRNALMLENVIAYILNNPIKAGICENWEEFDGNYVMKKYFEG